MIKKIAEEFIATVWLSFDQIIQSKSEVFASVFITWTKGSTNFTAVSSVSVTVWLLFTQSPETLILFV